MIDGSCGPILPSPLVSPAYHRKDRRRKRCRCNERKTAKTCSIDTIDQRPRNISWFIQFYKLYQKKLQRSGAANSQGCLSQDSYCETTWEFGICQEAPDIWSAGVVDFTNQFLYLLAVLLPSEKERGWTVKFVEM